MKNIYIYITVCMALIFAATACNDSFLEKNPTHNIVNPAFWKTSQDLKIYNNGIYEMFARDNLWKGNGNAGYNSSFASSYAVEAMSDNFTSLVALQDTLVRQAAGLHVIPDASSRWNFSVLRRVNVFLDNYTNVKAAFEDIQSYVGEAHLFRAWIYYQKVQEFGDVPWTDRALDPDLAEDLAILYGPRTPRKEVMDHVLADLKKAEEYLPTVWPANHPNRMTKWVALAAISRVGLYEGTYRKYHNLGDADKFLAEGLRASQLLIDSSPYDIYNTANPAGDYRTLFTSEDLTSNKEVILPKIYVKPGMGHRVSGYIVTQSGGVTKDLVDDYLCLEADGTAKPVALSAIYNDDEFKNVFENRDPRLRQTVLHPDDAKTILWKPSSKGYPLLKGMQDWESSTGYHFIKSYEKGDESKGQNNETSDFPLIRFAEILLNYAELKVEMGQTLSSTDLDKTLNKLRKRAGMPNFDPNPTMDPKYAAEGISALLVEIRRERRIELSFEDFRYQDLMRWKKGAYLAKPMLGMRLEDADRAPGTRYEKASVTTVLVNGKKYVDAYAKTDYASEKRVFDETKHYLSPIPLGAIAKNSKLGQNPGWK